ncbi:hypothetical protein [Paenibacillus humicus]|uniref:hypothetical protein n=1 Tax=Paenibacillus humicus TaxID=412861 RepID=UPI003F5CDD04
MEASRIREVRVDDYRDIYLLNLDFNPNLHAFSEESVMKKIEILAARTNDVVFVYEPSKPDSSSSIL